MAGSCMRSSFEIRVFVPREVGTPCVPLAETRLPEGLTEVVSSPEPFVTVFKLDCGVSSDSVEDSAHETSIRSDG